MTQQISINDVVVLLMTIHTEIAKLDASGQDESIWHAMDVVDQHIRRIEKTKAVLPN